jgi:hypothetical protein
MSETPGDAVRVADAARERNVAECEQFAEEAGSTCAVGGHFPDLPFGPPPTFLPDPLPLLARRSQAVRP